ncbi:Fe2+-enterobactin ABC transporter substrate-binding protein [Streptomyces sp. CS090A]|uniref:Fe2+-enterobactin ABC transporter substrate-binding protein n=1 Tax=Streptomyces sp. CS090A TaxID=2162710 RepID=UPI000D51659F|nr:Fe2+-enterobactin ABC transporter substrate-binding protein [Streptomyces sp. CS090A]PVC89828.1 Fe2+-enterobactin ABC transporter substrate-binding protein [Streptomyces sp. CS090A]
MNGRQLRTRFKGAAVAVAGLLALTACGGGGSDAADGSTKGDQGGDKAAATTRSVKHDAGTTEKVPAQPKRIVSVSVTMTGHLLALDAPVIASQATPPSVITDKQGFFTQWSDAAAKNSVKVAYQGFEPDVEKVLALKPDLIIGASSGAENAEKFYDKLSVVAPTLLYRHDDVSWQDLTARLGKDLGLEKRATEVVAAHEKRVGEVKAAITVPKQSAALVRDNQSAMTVFTPESAQGRLLTSLGFTVLEPPAGKGQTQGGRSDFAEFSQEKVADTAKDSSLLFVSHTPEEITAATARPVWKDLAAVKDKRVYDLGLDTFRLDYYSAGNLIDKIEKAFG